MAEKTLHFPDDRRYAESDEWVQLNGSVARVGITDYAQTELSDIVFVEFPDVGAQVETDQGFGVVESVKAVSDLFAPVSGEIVEINGDLEEHPEWVNEDPYGSGWIVAIAPSNPDEVDGLMTAEKYRAYVESREQK